MKYIGNFKELVSNGDLVDVKLLTLPEQREIITLNKRVFEPGAIDYTHKEEFLSSATNPIKYVLFLNDWEIGHIFTHSTFILTDFKTGDLYQFDDDKDIIYSWANIGYSTFSTIEIHLSDKL